MYNSFPFAGYHELPQLTQSQLISQRISRQQRYRSLPFITKEAQTDEVLFFKNMKYSHNDKKYNCLFFLLKNFPCLLWRLYDEALCKRINHRKSSDILFLGMFKCSYMYEAL